MAQLQTVAGGKDYSNTRGLLSYKCAFRKLKTNLFAKTHSLMFKQSATLEFAHLQAEKD